jgi:YD repeat-containing protein
VGSLAVRVIRVIAAALLAVAAVAPAPLLAAEGSVERYDYDPLGRLIRVIDAAGKVTEYDYDPVGNIRAVRTGGSGSGLTPTVTGVSIASFRKGESAPVTVTGTNFTGARLTSVDPEIDASNVAVTATQLRFTVSATQAAIPGAKNFNITNSAGTANFSLTLAPPLPAATFNPQPFAVPPDNAPRTFNIVLSNADTVAHTVSLTLDNPAIATVTPASVSFAVGQTLATIQITGKTGGLSTVRLASATLPAASAPVFVTADFAGVRTAYAPLVGVVLEGSAGPGTPTTIDRLLSPAVGVALGAFFRGIEPRALVRGQTTRVVVSGANLQGVTGIAIAPSTGITVANVTPAPDGLSVAADLTVAADASVAQRQVVLSGTGGPFRPASADADRVWVVDGQPVITSIEPFQAAPGTSGITLRIRGRALQATQRILIPAASNVRISTAFTVNAEGTEIVGGMELPLNAVVGSYPVQVETAAGTSDGAPTPFNTFFVVNEIQAVYTPIFAPLVGVVNGTLPGTSVNVPLFSNAVGVALGAAVSGVAPRSAGIGQTTTVTLTGNALAGVTAAQITPADGVTVGPLTVAGDGRSATFDVTVTADAPRTLRRLRVLAGTAPVPFSQAELGSFLITQPVPVLDSVAPISLRAGDPPLVFTLRGRNMQLPSAVRFVPGTGIVVGTDLSANAEGTAATVSITVQAGAPTGQRTVVIETPAGTSSATATLANTVTVGTTISEQYDAIMAPLVGVQNGPLTGPQPITVGPLLSPLVGVVIEQPVPPGSSTYTLHSLPIGVALGPVATRLEQTSLVAGSSGVLTITGVGLDAVTLVGASPAAGITLGDPAVTGAGTQLTVPITVAAGTGATPRELQLVAGAVRVPFAQAASSVFYVAVGAPNIDSIDPTMGRQGEGIALLIRGDNLQFATGVLVEPAQGVAVVSAPAVNSSGTEATVSLRIAADAALGGRVIRIVTPGGTTSAVPEPANTFTVFTP